MKLHQRRAVQIGTEAFLAAEVSAEETLINKLRCLETLLQQHRNARLMPEVGMDAFLHIGRGIALQAEAFVEIRKAHPFLREVAASLDPRADFGTSPTIEAEPFQDRQGVVEPIAA